MQIQSEIKYMIQRFVIMNIMSFSISIIITIILFTIAFSINRCGINNYLPSWSNDCDEYENESDESEDNRGDLQIQPVLRQLHFFRSLFNGNFNRKLLINE